MGSDYSEIYNNFDYIMFRSAVKSKLVALGGRLSYQYVAEKIEEDGMIDAREVSTRNSSLEYIWFDSSFKLLLISFNSIFLAR